MRNLLHDQQERLTAAIRKTFKQYNKLHSSVLLCRTLT